MAATDDLSTRAKDQWPQVVVTLLSIVQALALELLWDHVNDRDYLHHFSWPAVLGWAEVGATLVGVVLIWVIYSTMTMRFRWVPTIRDLVFPFVIGIIELSLIASLGVATLGIWFLLLALVYAAMAWESQMLMRRARLDGENEIFFQYVPPATMRDFVPVFVTVTFLALVGVYLWLTGDQGAIAFVALVAANGGLAYQLWLNNHFWRRSVGLM
jgi:hypothetical protein